MKGEEQMVKEKIDTIRNLMAKWLAIGLPLLAMSHLLSAAEPTGASFLKIGVGARAEGMGSAFTAVADDASAAQWNPGGLARLTRRELSVTHADFIADVTLNSLGYVHPFQWGAVGVEGLVVTQEPLEGRGASREKTEDFNASDEATALSIGWRGERYGAGVKMKYVRQRLAKQTASGPAVDVGLLSDTPLAFLKAGLAVQNLGPSRKFIDEQFLLPLTVTGGLAVFWGETARFAVDVKRRVYERRTAVSAGMEFELVSTLVLRAGYVLPFSQGGETRVSDTDKLVGLGGGLGLRFFMYHVDYSFSPAGDLGETHRFTLGLKF